MSFGRTKEKRRQAARGHLRNVHICGHCGKKIRGNAYYRHAKACRSMRQKSIDGGATDA
jgi:ribosomal protein L37AE/L43A